MIVGFPGESEADFEETLSLTETVRYHSMFSFKYSERPNTLASNGCGRRRRPRRRGDRGAAAQRRSSRTSSSGDRPQVLVDATSRRREWS
jgi:tRNA-2-methylthio-N6-dimethylallyladenosine synthase